MLVAALAGVIGAGAGFAAGLAVGGLLAALLSISSFEGASGYFTGAVGLLFGTIGFFAAIVLSLRYQGQHRRIGDLAGRTLAAVAALAAIAGAAVVYRIATVEHFSGAAPQMHFEIRLPAGMATPDLKRIDAEMQAGSQRSGATFREPRLENDRIVIPGMIALYTRTSQRILVFRMPSQPRVLFRIGLAATPLVSDKFGPWQRADYVDDGKLETQPRKPAQAEDFDIRIRVPAWR